MCGDLSELLICQKPNGIRKGDGAVILDFWVVF